MAVALDLKGKVAIVTGAARGIGQATALALAGAGAKVLVSDMLPEEESKTVGIIKGAGGEARFWQTDVSQKDQVEKLISAALDFGGRIDILVNNAGILRVSSFLELQEKDWDDVLAVNLKGTFLCAQLAARQMIKQDWGRIINLGSVVGKIPRWNNIAYCASKAAIIHITKVMALDLAKHGITANAICPGPTETEMIFKVQSGGNPVMVEKMVKGDLDTFRGGIPLGRMGKPEEIANLAVYLASDQAGYITGQAISIDGGNAMI